MITVSVSRTLTLQQAAEMAIAVQDACNLSGVLLSYVEIVQFLRSQGLDTRALARHPVSQLFAEKVADLAGVSSGSLATFGPAYAQCKAIAGIVDGVQS